MRKMPGMETAVRAKTTQLEGMSWVREDGRPYGVLRPTGNPDQQALISEYEIFRGDLAQILFDMTKDHPNIKYVFGEQVASLQQSEKEVMPSTVEFTNGLPASAFDLVVACDGASSRTRAMGLDCGVRDYTESVNCWTAYFSLQGDRLKGEKIGLGYSAVGGRAVTLGPDPSGATRAMLMRVHPRKDPDATLPFREAQKQGTDALKRFIAKQYEGVGWRTEEAIQGMMDADDFYAHEMIQVKPPTIYKGRFVMVGDAGYAPGPTGGGTSLALAGAYLLAGEVGKHPGDLAAALRGYAERMQPIISDLQTIPPLVPLVIAPWTAWGIWLRNHIFAFIVWSRVIDFVQRVFFAGAFASADKHKLPDYEWVE